MSRHLHIDPFAGAAGDMFLGACIDLGAPLSRIESALRSLPIPGPWRLTAEPTLRHAIRGIDFKVHFTPPARSGHSHSHDHGHSHAHGHDHSHSHSHSHDHDHGPTLSQRSAAASGDSSYRHILSLIDRLPASPLTRDRARRILKRLGEAEAAVHGIPLDQVHFHEVGAVDSIVDMLGSALALELLDVTTLSSAPLPIGHGFVQCDHGNMPLPAPATAQILIGVPHYGVDRVGETVTPTGAAIIAALVEDFGPMPPMQVEKVGYGAGDRDPPDVPNLLRLHLGRRFSL